MPADAGTALAVCLTETDSDKHAAGKSMGSKSSKRYVGLESDRTSKLFNGTSKVWSAGAGFAYGLIGSTYRFATALWPYVAIALLLPGGSILALALWLLRRIRNVTASSSETTS